MKQILNDKNSRANSCTILLNHIKELEEKAGKILESSIIKSSLLIMLYNNIEATVYAAFEKIHATANAIEYEDLSISTKKICTNYHFNNPKYAFENIEKILSKSLSLPLLEEYGKRINLFSGNLDEKKINAIAKVYGIPITKPSGTKNMLVVKQKRNKLAHGEESFLASCRGYTSKDLSQIKESCEDFLSRFIINVELYLNKRMYLRNPAL